MRAKAPAKLNIFLKITGFRGSYHEIVSRFIRYEELYDEIAFVPGSYERFEIEGTPEIPREQNIIYKAFCALNKATGNPKIIDFFFLHKVQITKRIPQGAGLGGGSSDAATFLLLANKHIGLRLSQDVLAAIGAEVGADVPFFIYGYEAANVRGIGEIIEPFADDIPPIALQLLPIHCDTAAVYSNWRKKYADTLHIGLAERLARMTSRQILSTIAPSEANDLYVSAADLCPKLRSYQESWYLSGSGSTIFRSRDEGDSHK